MEWSEARKHLERSLMCHADCNCTYCEAIQVTLREIDRLTVDQDKWRNASEDLAQAEIANRGAPNEQEGETFWAIVITDGNGNYWSTHVFQPTREEAEELIYKSDLNTKVVGVFPIRIPKPVSETDRLLSDIEKFLAPLCDDRIESHNLLKRAIAALKSRDPA